MVIKKAKKYAKEIVLMPINAVMLMGWSISYSAVVIFEFITDFYISYRNKKFVKKYQSGYELDNINDN